MFDDSSLEELSESESELSVELSSSSGKYKNTLFRIPYYECKIKRDILIRSLPEVAMTSVAEPDCVSSSVSPDISPPRR